MTIITMYPDIDFHATVYEINGCFKITIYQNDMVSVGSFSDLVRERLTPFVAMAMPVHDISAL